MGKTSTESHRCPNCSAPLTQTDLDASTTCRYCGHSVRIVSQTPREPPEPSHHHASSHRARTGGFHPVHAVGVLISILGIGGAVLSAARPALRTLSSQHATLPARCEANESITIEGKTFRSTQSSAVIFSGPNCTIHIRDSTIESHGPIVVAGVNTRVHISGSKLSSQTRAIEAAVNVAIDIANGSVIDGAEAGIDANSNVTLEVTQAEVRSAATAIKAETSFQAKFDQATIISQRVAVEAGSSATITARATTIKGTEVGIHLSRSGGILTLRGSTVTSGQHAIEVDQGGQLSLDDQTEVRGEHGNGLLLRGSNGKINLSRATIVGGGLGLEAGSNTELLLRAGAKISGQLGAVAVGSNAKISVEGGTLESPVAALTAGRNATVRIAEGSRVAGKPPWSFAGPPAKLDAAPGTQAKP